MICLRVFLIWAVAFILPLQPLQAAPNPADLDRIIAPLAATIGTGGRLGIGLKELSTGQTWFLNGDTPFPMQSVFKLPLAVAVLQAAEANRLRLDDVITVSRRDFRPGYNALKDKIPGDTAPFTIRQLLGFSTGNSDNTSADLLMQKIGGPNAVNAMLRRAGVTGIRVDRYENELAPEHVGLPAGNPDWADPNKFVAAKNAQPLERQTTALETYLRDPRDTATPIAMIEFLQKFWGGKLLIPSHTALLKEILWNSPTGAKRVKAGLPPGSRFAHKTGTGASLVNRASAVNDVGIVTLPDGREYLLAIFLSGTPLPEEAREQLHAEVTRTLFASRKGH